MVTKQQHSLKSRPETQDPQSSTLKPRTLRIMSHDPGTWDSEIKDLGPKTLGPWNWDTGIWDRHPGHWKWDPGTMRLATEPHHRLY